MTVDAGTSYTMALYSEGAKKGLATRAQTSDYILSGLLKCSKCGANLVIISGRGRKHARYGCSQHWNRGACENDLTIHRDVVEQCFFADLQAYADNPEAINLVVDEFVRQLREALDGEIDGGQRLLDRKRQIEAELERLTSAIAQGAPVKAMKAALKERSRELRDLEDALVKTKPVSIFEEADALRRFAVQRIFDIVSLFRGKAQNAKFELSKHCGELWMTALKNAEGERFYVGVGQWSLEGFLGDGFTPSLCVSNWNKNGHRKFADFYSLSNSISINTSGVLEEPVLVEENIPKCNEIRRLGIDAEMEELLNVNASGAWLNGGVRSVAGARNATCMSFKIRILAS
jgi:Recombinase zinc beta ribbon domain